MTIRCYYNIIKTAIVTQIKDVCINNEIFPIFTINETYKMPKPTHFGEKAIVLGNLEMLDGM